MAIVAVGVRLNTKEWRAGEKKTHKQQRREEEKADTTGESAK